MLYFADLTGHWSSEFPHVSCLQPLSDGVTAHEGVTAPCNLWREEEV